MITPARIDTSGPNPARVWDYMNGGRDNFETDRRVARHLMTAAPALAAAGLASWAFRRRVVTHLADEAGIRQFIDISMGMRGTATSNTHAVAGAVAPRCRVVYVAQDPVVLSHARATIRSAVKGAISYVETDPRHIESILDGIRGTLDFTEPIGVIMPDTLNFTRNASGAIARLAAAVPSGSYLAVIQAMQDERMALAARRWNRFFNMPVYLRDRDEVAGWFKNLDLIQPGAVQIHRWRPGPDEPVFPAGMPLLGAVARKR